MSAVIDFRNGRYQGEVRNKRPHGVGAFFAADLTLTFAQWTDGRIDGKAIVLYSDGTVFSGTISNGLPASTCYYELQKEKIKVFFEGEAKENSKFAVVIPNFSLIFELQRSTLEIIGKHPYSKHDQQANQKVIQQITGKPFNAVGQQFQSFLSFFQEHFCFAYPELFQHLVLGISGAIEYSIGFRLDGLGAKIRPLGIEEMNGTTYKICQTGVMTKENVLCGIGMKISNTILNKMKVEEGVFSFVHTLTTYQYSDEPQAQKAKNNDIRQTEGYEKRNPNRPTKCLVTFLNYLKRSLFYTDKYLHQKEGNAFKKEIDRISEVTFVELKVKNAHEIIENPISNQSVLAEIQLKRRKKKEESSMFQRGQFASKFTPNIYNSGDIHPASSAFNLNTLKEDLQRSISKKKKLNKSINKDTSATYVTPTKTNKSNERRLNGSITPPHKRNNQGQSKKFGVLVSKTRKDSANASPGKYQTDRIEEKGKERDVSEQAKKTPAPILKRIMQAQPKPAKVSFRDKQLQEWEKSKLRLQKTASSPKKYSDIHRKTKAPSPSKAYNRPILTENIFD